MIVNLCGLKQNENPFVADKRVNYILMDCKLTGNVSVL